MLKQAVRHKGMKHSDRIKCNTAEKDFRKPGLKFPGRDTLYASQCRHTRVCLFVYFSSFPRSRAGTHQGTLLRPGSPSWGRTGQVCRSRLRCWTPERPGSSAPTQKRGNDSTKRPTGLKTQVHGAYQVILPGRNQAQQTQKNRRAVNYPPSGINQLFFVQPTT
jgi:hypothetical protein